MGTIVKKLPINKEVLVRKLNDEMGEGLVKAHHTIEAVLKVIVDTLMQGEEIRIQNFGTFKLKFVKERVCTLPSVEEGTVIPAHYKVQFAPSYVLSEAIKEISVDK